VPFVADVNIVLRSSLFYYIIFEQYLIYLIYYGAYCSKMKILNFYVSICFNFQKDISKRCN